MCVIILYPRVPHHHSLAWLLDTSLWFSHSVHSQETCNCRLSLHRQNWASGREIYSLKVSKSKMEYRLLLCFIFIKTRSTTSTPIKWMLTNIFEHQLFSKLLLNSLCIFRPSLHIFWTIRGRGKRGGHTYKRKAYNLEKNQSVNRIKTKQFRWITQKRFDLVLVLLTLPVSSIAQRKHRILRTNHLFLEFLS